MKEGGWLNARVERRHEDGSIDVRVWPLDDSQPLPKPEKHLLVKLRQARNPKHHRKYWALMGALAQASDRWQSAEDVHRWLKWELKMYTPVAVRDGYTVLEWESTDFASMDQRSFAEFYETALATIALETGINADALVREIE